MKTLTVRNVTIGQGVPKICISLTGRSMPELIEETKLAMASGPDIFEWRADNFEHADDPDCIIESLKMLRFLIKDSPLIFTLRSENEGGKKTLNLQEYTASIKAALKSGETDIIDVEMNRGNEAVTGLIEYIHRNGGLALMSVHDFTGTPSEDEIISILRKMQELGADIPKLAVMARSEEDVLVLLKATLAMSKKYADRPFTTVAMGETGVISRMCGGVFGSSMTYAKGREALAPGQLSVQELQQTLKLLHKPSESGSEYEIEKSIERRYMMRQIIKTDKAPIAVGAYSQGVCFNGTLFTSGQIPIDPDTGLLVTGDIVKQAEQAMKNVKAIVEAAELTMDDVIKVTILLADIGDFVAVNEVYQSFFKGSYPARSCFAVKDLPKGVGIEIEAIAGK